MCVCEHIKGFKERCLLGPKKKKNANIRGNPLCQATKQHLKTVKRWKTMRSVWIWFQNATSHLCFRISFFVRTVVDWNHLDCIAIHVDSVNSFKALTSACKGRWTTVQPAFTFAFKPDTWRLQRTQQIHNMYTVVSGILYSGQRSVSYKGPAIWNLLRSCPSFFLSQFF